MTAKVNYDDPRILIFNRIRHEMHRLGIRKNEKVDSVEDYFEHFNYITEKQYFMLLNIFESLTVIE